jgi:tubulin polyglutamylase TTLL9
MYQDMLDIVDLEGRREPGKYPATQGGFDLIWDNGPFSSCELLPTSLSTMLGCFNYRDQNQLRKSLAEMEDKVKEDGTA